MKRNPYGAPPHHHVPADIGRSIGVVIQWGAIGALVGLVLAVGADGPWRPVGFVGATIAGLIHGVMTSERISDSHRYQQAQKARRRVAGD